MPSLNDLEKLGNWFVGLVVAIGFGISHLRQKKNETDTGAGVEAAKQASARVYVEQLADTRQALADERVRCDKALQNLRDINDNVRKQFDASITEFRITLATRDERIGVLIEDVAEWRGKAEALQAEKVDLMAAVQRQRNDCNEEKRALTASYERVIASMKSDYTTLEALYHDMVNKAHGDGTATEILGPKE